DAREEADQEDRRATGRRQEAHLPRRGVQGQRGDQRHREQGDLRADLRDRRAGPELQELTVPPERGHFPSPRAPLGLPPSLRDERPQQRAERLAAALWALRPALLVLAD